jgi:D-alanyl-D-alanine carboxypeptidase/D-alanyl-D-alanine-endopeptidase (penicillin-binding protein 4)
MLAAAAALILWYAPDAIGAGTAELNRRIDAIVKQAAPAGYSISVQLADARSGKILAEKNPDLPLMPASTMKVATSWAALSVLKPDFTMVTEVLADRISGASAGNIYLKGLGDPYLVSEQLFALTREVSSKGLSEIRGDIIVDDSYFIPDKPLDEQEKLGHRSYHAPYSALSLNFNSLKIVVHPGAKPGQAAKVSVDPDSEYATVIAAVKTAAGKQPANLDIQRDSDPSGRDVIRVGGAIGVEAASKGRYVNVSSPPLYVGEVFKEYLLREGIRVSGKVIRGQTPADAALYCSFNSQPLAVIVYWLNKFSNNFMAEQLCLALGAAVHGAPGTREKGLSVIRKQLLSIGVDESAFQLAEASGLSRKNRLSSAALVRVLLTAAQDFSCYPEFVSSLGVAGADGTLKEKFAENGLKRRLRAKTGNLRGVNALAGYGLSPDGRQFAFAVIVNAPGDNAGFIDHGEKILRAVLDIPLGQF